MAKENLYFEDRSYKFTRCTASTIDWVNIFLESIWIERENPMMYSDSPTNR